MPSAPSATPALTTTELDLGGAFSAKERRPPQEQSLSERKNADIRCVLIVGAGTMGQQIGLQCAMYGYEVVVYDIAPDALEAARAQINA